MPNWVYNHITLQNATKAEKEHLEKIAKVGLARYYMPMPKELEEVEVGYPDVRSNAEKKKLADKYGYDNWYDWARANENWGTKWGCCENDYHDDPSHPMYSYNTAWSPLNLKLIRAFAKDFPNFIFEWEEEQGFGQEYECINGRLSLVKEWDIPECEVVVLDEHGNVDEELTEEGVYVQSIDDEDEAIEGVLSYMGITVEDLMGKTIKIISPDGKEKSYEFKG